MEKFITMSYGSGGKKTSELIEKVIIPKINNSELKKLGDGAILKISTEDIVFSTDSFVVNPIFFPGGDIGKLSVCGTVNDLLVCGSVPKFISLSFIIEEGFELNKFEKLLDSISEASVKAGVKIVTGDTKVVEKGFGNDIYINTAGIGEKIENISLEKVKIKKGDVIIVSGEVGNHGISIFSEREHIFEEHLLSDCNNLNNVVFEILKYKNDVKFLRDPTRGGLATTLNELCEDMDFSFQLFEEEIPINRKVKSVCDLYGLDPLYSANEGIVIAIVSEKVGIKIVEALNKMDDGKNAKIIGYVTEEIGGKVLLRNKFGSIKVLDKLAYDMLPRIC